MTASAARTRSHEPDDAARSARSLPAMSVTVPWLIPPRRSTRTSTRTAGSPSAASRTRGSRVCSRMSIDGLSGHPSWRSSLVRTTIGGASAARAGLPLAANPAKRAHAQARATFVRHGFANQTPTSMPTRARNRPLGERPPCGERGSLASATGTKPAHTLGSFGRCTAVSQERMSVGAGLLLRAEHRRRTGEAVAAARSPERDRDRAARAARRALLLMRGRARHDARRLRPAASTRAPRSRCSLRCFQCLPGIRSWPRSCAAVPEREWLKKELKARSRRWVADSARWLGVVRHSAGLPRRSRDGKIRRWLPGSRPLGSLCSRCS
jgi:hypothetical protein